MKGRASQAELIAQKLESKLQGSSEVDEKITGTLNELKKSLNELKSNGIGSGSNNGLSDSDKTFLKELTNDTRDAISDMRLEVLTASDKSEWWWENSIE